jgi:hypothetical protein
MRDKEYSYLAGLIDGDGCLFIRIEMDKSRPRSLGITPELNIALHIDSCWLLDQIREEFGGNINYQRKDARKWSITKRKELRLIIKKLIPYLRLKRNHAKLILKAMDIMDKTKPPRPRPIEEILELAEIKEELHRISSHKKRFRKWNYLSIRKFLENSPIYSKDYKDVRLEVGKRYGFRKGNAPWNKGLSYSLEDASQLAKRVLGV